MAAVRARSSSASTTPSGSGSRWARILTICALVSAPTLDLAFARWCFTVECDRPSRWAAAFSDPATGTAATTPTSRSVARLAVEPGPFRTDWSGRSKVHSPRTIHDYDAFYEPIREARDRYNGRQPGDPEKAGAAVLSVIDAGDPPKHLLLGADAITALTASRRAFDEDIARWESVTRSTDFTPR